MKNKLFLALALSAAFAAMPVKASAPVIGAACLSIVGNMAALNLISSVLDGGLLPEQKAIKIVGAVVLTAGLPVFETKCMAQSEQEKMAVLAVDTLLGCSLAYAWNFMYSGTFKSPVRVGVLAGVLKAVGGLISVV